MCARQQHAVGEPVNKNKNKKNIISIPGSLLMTGLSKYLMLALSSLNRGSCIIDMYNCAFVILCTYNVCHAHVYICAVGHVTVCDLK